MSRVGDSSHRQPGAIEFVDPAALLDPAVGSRITFYRNKAAMTQAELARKCGTSQATLSRIERDPSRATLSLLGKICECLGIPVSALTDSPTLPVSEQDAGHIRLRHLRGLSR